MKRLWNLVILDEPASSSSQASDHTSKFTEQTYLCDILVERFIV